MLFVVMMTVVMMVVMMPTLTATTASKKPDNNGDEDMGNDSDADDTYQQLWLRICGSGVAKCRGT